MLLHETFSLLPAYSQALSTSHGPVDHHQGAVLLHGNPASCDAVAPACLCPPNQDHVCFTLSKVWMWNGHINSPLG